MRIRKITKEIKKIIAAFAFGIGMLLSTSKYIFAIGDPTAAIGNLTTLIAGIVSAAGVLILIWASVNLGLAIKRRDPASTSEATFGVIGGLLIAAAPWVAKYLAG